MAAQIRVLIVDDHPVVRLGLRSIIERQPDMVVVAEASNGDDALKCFRNHHPDITLMDLRMKGITGGETINKICAQFPSAKILVLSNYSGDEDIFRALRAGARGYLLKEMAETEVVSAIRIVIAGRKYIPPEVGARLAEHSFHSDLTDRELQVLQLIAKGKSNKEIASLLEISQSTVKIHVNNILSKLGVSDRTDAATTAVRRGLIYLD